MLKITEETEEIIRHKTGEITLTLKMCKTIRENLIIPKDKIGWQTVDQKLIQPHSDFPPIHSWHKDVHETHFLKTI